MKKYLLALMVVVSAMSVVVTDAEARRLGGGGSFGRQSSGISRQAIPPSSNHAAPSQARPASPAATPQGVTPRPASPWRNVLGGALLGLGLGALLSHFGLGGAMAGMISTILMIALIGFAIMFVMRLLRGKNTPSRDQPAYASGYDSGLSARTPEIGSRIEPQIQPAALQSAPLGGATAAAPLNVPAGFDSQSFLRHAKTYFIRLQAAWDRADINDIREFTTSEMFAELRLQLQERGASPNNTDVVSLEADLVGMEQIGDEYLASVRFSGLIKEAENAPAEQFAEVWNLTKSGTGQSGWLLAGIQQLSGVS